MRVVAAIILLLLLPLFGVIALAIFISSGRPILFKQSRVGWRRREFVIYKFRTMQNDRITSVGRLLRKAGLDELPQLINIMRNEMSFVGPRPLTASDVTRLGWDLPEYERRWSVKPGITGRAQLLTVCDAEHSIQSDLLYVEQKNVREDLRILCRSIIVPFVANLERRRARNESTG